MTKLLTQQAPDNQKVVFIFRFKTFQENHQSLASDVHAVEESVAIVDDCLNLLDKSKFVFFMCIIIVSTEWRYDGLIFSALGSGSRGLGLSPFVGDFVALCVVILGEALYSHSASLHPGV